MSVVCARGRYMRVRGGSSSKNGTCVSTVLRAGGAAVDSYAPEQRPSSRVAANSRERGWKQARVARARMWPCTPGATCKRRRQHEGARPQRGVFAHLDHRRVEVQVPAAVEQYRDIVDLFGRGKLVW